MPRDLKYEQQNKIVAFGTIEIKCMNWALCDNTFPEFWYDIKGKYLCTCCYETFGHKLMQCINDCSVCGESKHCFVPVKCDHQACIDCFRKIHMGGPNIGKFEDDGFEFTVENKCPHC